MKKITAIILIMAFILPLIPIKSYAINSEQEFFNYLDSIGVPKSNTANKVANYLTYKEYGLIVYGSPWGDRKPTGINGKTGPQYRYLGYTLEDDPYTNPYFPPDASSGNKPENFNYIKPSGAEESWESLTDKAQKEHMLYSTLSGNGATSPSFTLASIGGYAYGKLLSPSTWKSQGSIYLQHKTSSGKIWYITQTTPPMVGNTLLTGTISTPHNTYTIKSEDKSVIVPVTVTSNAVITGSAKPSHIAEITATFHGQTDRKSGISTASTTKDLILTRENYGVGTHTITLEGTGTLKTIFNDQDSIKPTKTITLIVEPEGPDPYVTTIATPNPESAKFEDKDIDVTIKVDGSLHNYKDTANIKEWKFFAREKEESIAKEKVNYTKTLNSSTSFKFKIPKEKIVGDTYKQEYIVRARVYFNKPVNGKMYLDAPAQTVVLVYTEKGKPETPKPPSPKPTPPPYNAPPVAVLSAPSSVKAGTTFNIHGFGSFDLDGTVDEYFFEHGLGNKYQRYFRAYDGEKPTVDIMYPTEGDKTITLAVWDNHGAMDETFKIVKVLPPTPDAIITTGGYLKQNRIVELDPSKSTSPELYPLEPNKTIWQIEPMDGQSVNSIKYKDNLEGMETKEVLFKEPGRYKVTLTVWNTANLSDTQEKIIEIVPDLEPVADFNTVTTIYRNADEENYATIEVFDSSYSPDYDIIINRIWRYAFDSDNDGSFDDETWITIDDTNKKEIEIKTQKVGKYKFELEIVEEFGQPTISEFITSSDIKKANTDNKRIEEKIVEVDNFAPVVDFNLSKKRKVDLVFNVTDSKHNNLSTINSQINSTLKPLLQSKGIDYNIQVVDNKPSKLTKLFFYGGNEYNTHYSFMYDYIDESMRKIADSNLIINAKNGLGNMLLGSNGKFYYMKTFNSIYEYDPETDKHTPLYNGGKIVTRLDINDDRYAGANNIFIGEDNSIYFFEYVTDASNIYKQRYLRKLNTNTLAITTYRVDTTWDRNVEIIGVDKYGNVIVSEGFSPSNAAQAYINGNKATYISIYKPNGTVTKIAEHGWIMGGTLNKDGLLVYLSSDGILTGYDSYGNAKYEWSEPVFTSITITSNGNGNNKTNLGNLGISGLWAGDIIKFKSSDANTLIIFMDNLKTYEYNINTKTLSVINNNQISNNSFGFKAYGGKYYFPFDNTKIYEYNENDKTFMLSKLNKDILDPYNIPTVTIPGGRDPDTGERYPETKYLPTLKIYPYLINEYVSNTNIRIPDGLDKAIEKVEWRDDTERYFINIADNVINELNKPERLSKIIVNSINNQIDIVGFGTLKNQNQYNTLFNNIEGTFINNDNFNQALTELYTYIESKEEQNEIEQYLLLGDEILIETFYADRENDLMYQDRWIYKHDHTYFDNSLGQISDSGVFRSSPYTKFDKVGKYEVTYQAQDNPISDTRFSNYRKWSKDNLCKLTLLVHRKPIPVFTVKVNHGYTTSTVTITESSYDLDHQSQSNKGISQRQWQWKELNETSWREGMPPTILTSGKWYLVRLRVRDIDGPNGLGVWSDWKVQEINTGNFLLPPVAQFTIDPNTVSRNPKFAISIKDNSYSPISATITTREWQIKRLSDNKILYSSNTQPTSTTLKSYGIGKYEVQLRVKDSHGQYSNYDRQIYEVVNHPPVAEFIVPTPVYRDTTIKLVNESTDKDEDTLTYTWKVNIDGKDYSIGNEKEPTFTIQNLIDIQGLNPKKTISDNNYVKLDVSDGLLKSNAIERFEVLNHKPVAVINGPSSVKQYETVNYLSGSYDNDSADNPILIYRWNLTNPKGFRQTYNTKDISVNFDMSGEYTLEHFVIDQIGDKSDIVTLIITVEENLAPSIVITNPNGTVIKPTILSGEPLIEWEYSDPENDPQEKYTFDFFDTDDVITYSILKDDNTGNIRKYQVPQNTLERFSLIKVIGRAFSKDKWSNPSNEVYFIINDAPIPGFTLDKHTIVRGEEINVISTAYDPNEIKGDFLTHKYYIKKLPNGPENLYTDLKDFTFTINTLTSNRVSDQYQIRQVVTDSLGVSSEHTEIFTVVNQKPNVEILEPSSSNKNNPYSYSDLKPTIRWSYSDLDGDSQKKYIVNIFEGDTNSLVVSSGEISSSSSSWTLPIELVEDKLYSVRVEVYDGHEWNTSSTKYFQVFSLKISGYLVPNPAMAGDKIYFYITTEGYADKLEIVVPNDLIAMDKRVEMGYPAVSYPSLFFNVDKNVYKKEDILDYIVWVTTEETIDKNNVRLRQPYKFIIRAYKGEMTKEIELELDIKGNILELLKPGIKNKYGN